MEAYFTTITTENTKTENTVTLNNLSVRSVHIRVLVLMDLDLSYQSLDSSNTRLLLYPAYLPTEGVLNDNLSYN